MSTTTSYCCDGPGCLRHVNGTLHSSIPSGCGFITVTESLIPLVTRHFCGWDCVLRHAASYEPEEVIPVEPDGPTGGDDAH